MSYKENGQQTHLKNCYAKLDLMEANFRYCSDSKELHKSLGVYKSAAREIVALAHQLREELLMLEGGL